MGTLLFLAFVVLAIGTFSIVTFPLVFLANKAIAAAWEREAEQMKQSLARTTLGFSEDARRRLPSACAGLAQMSGSTATRSTSCATKSPSVVCTSGSPACG